jgi:hypothetical protein
MSKKKPAKKTAAKKAAPKKASARKKAPARKAARAARTLSAAPAAPGKRNNTATIFLYQVDGAFRVRTSPQLISAAPGYVEWTVVNLTADDDPEVEITWDGEGPWKGETLKFKGNKRKSLGDATPGRYKYYVTANGYTEDPELEYPEGN